MWQRLKCYFEKHDWKVEYTEFPTKYMHNRYRRSCKHCEKLQNLTLLGTWETSIHSKVK